MSSQLLRQAEFTMLGLLIESLSAGRGAAVALVGEPGIGKTVLVTALVAQARTSPVTVVTVTGRTDVGLPEVTGAEPTLVTIDDAHLLDPAYVEQVERLIERTTTAPILLVLAYRDRQLSRQSAAALSRAAARGDLAQRRLGPLDLGQTRSLLGARPDLARLHAEGDGNPLYLQLLAADAESMTDAHLALLGELAALPDTELRVAQAVAVLRTPASAGLVAVVAGLDVVETMSALDILTDLDLLRPVQLTPRVAFRHDVVRRFVYAQIGPGQRLVAHQRAGTELLARGAPITQSAHHIARSIDAACPEQLTILLDAARSAVHTAPAEALEWSETVLQLLPEGDDRWLEAHVLALRARLLRGSRCDVQDLVHSLLPRATRTPGGDFSSTIVVAAQVRRLQGRHAEASALVKEGLATLASAHLPTAVAMHTELAELALNRSDQEAAHQHAREAVGIARVHRDRLGEATALAQSAMAHLLATDTDAAERAADLAADLVDTASDTAVVTNLPGLHLVGTTEEALHRFTEAQRHLGRCADQARRTGQLFILPTILASLGTVELQRGLLDRAHRTLNEAAELLEPEGAAAVRATILAHHALVRFWREADGDAAASAAVAEQACALVREPPSLAGTTIRCLHAELLIRADEPERGRRSLLAAVGGPHLPQVPPSGRARWYEVLALAALRVGDEAQARRWAELADASVRSLSTPPQGFLRRTWMRLHTARGETEMALTAAEQAAECFADRGMDLELCRTLVAAGTLLVDAGRPADAQSWLGRAAALADQCGSARLAERVRRQQRRLTVTAAPSTGCSAALAGLTGREREIATLVSEGLTSVKVAQQLFLSVRTVDTHLGRIYRKLGVANRASLARAVLGSEPVEAAGPGEVDRSRR